MRNWLKRLERESRGNLESFELLDGSRYYYDSVETHKSLFLHAYDSYSGVVNPAPEIFHQICRARDPEAVLARFTPENHEKAFVNPADLYDHDALVHERKLIPIIREEPEDLSEP